MILLLQNPFWVLAILLLLLPLIAAVLLRRREKKFSRAVLSGVFCGLILSGYGLYQVDIQGEMGGYTWLFFYTPMSAILGFIAGFAFTFFLSAVASSKSSHRGRPNEPLD